MALLSVHRLDEHVGDVPFLHVGPVGTAAVDPEPAW
jgi:hypothetical protein